MSYLLFFCSILFSGCSGCSEQTQVCHATYSDCIDACSTEDCRLDCGDAFKSCTGLEYIFPIHFCVVTANDSAPAKTSLTQLETEVDILNTYFTAEDSSLDAGRRKMVIFTFKSASFFNDVNAIGSDLVDHLQQAAEYDGTGVQTKFNSETNTLVRDPHAINIYIYDSWSGGDWSDHGGHARNNGDEPYILLDYARLNHHIQAPEEHEMGHAFGLAHICSASGDNIMGSGGDYPANGSYSTTGADTMIDCSYTGGSREVGFNAAQCQIILQNASEIHATLGL